MKFGRRAGLGPQMKAVVEKKVRQWVILVVTPRHFFIIPPTEGVRTGGRDPV
jgi:hypothetical protein